MATIAAAAIAIGTRRRLARRGPACGRRSAAGDVGAKTMVGIPASADGCGLRDAGSTSTAPARFDAPDETAPPLTAAAGPLARGACSRLIGSDVTSFASVITEGAASTIGGGDIRIVASISAL